MTQSRDSQKSKFGRAFAATPTDREWDYETALSFHNKVINSRWWRSRIPDEHSFVPRPVFRYHGDRKTLLYHLAWYLCDRTQPRHSREFCRTYLAIVRRFMDADAAATLLAAYREYRVHYSKSKTMTPERKAALQEQIIKARQAKVAKVWDRMEQEYEV